MIELIFGQLAEGVVGGDCGRSWRARRVDLIVVPVSQYYYALVGWTGSKHFNRSLRLYAHRQFGWHLTSHCLYDPVTVSVQIFAYLDYMLFFAKYPSTPCLFQVNLGYSVPPRSSSFTSTCTGKEHQR